MTRTLLLLRHAEAMKAHGRAPDDFDRFLSARGQDQAHAIGRRLRSESLTPETIVSSPAERARETATIVCHELDLPRIRIHWDKRLYEDNTTDLMPVLRDLDGTAATALVVGHNPGLERLVQQLARPRAPVGLSTATVARLSLDGTWRELSPGCARWENLLRGDNQTTA